MRKIFTLFAAMLVAAAVNAAIEPGTNALSGAISAADPGATIELSDGTFTESSSITITQSITIKAADMGKKPTLQAGGSIYVSSGADVKFVGINIKADGSHDVFDISSGGVFELDSCEIYNMAARRVIKVGNSAHTDAIKIYSCYMYGGTSYPAIEVESNSTQNGCDLIEIKNSTFANFTIGNKAVIALNSKGSAKASSASDDVDLIVDRCTFYNCTKTSPESSSTYGCIDLRKSSKATISNCIFANPASIPEGHYASRATQLYGGTVSNCLVDAYTPNHRSDDITINNPLKDVDPLFQDAENGDFTLSETSPALTAGTDGGAIGDPRWVKKITLYLKAGVWNTGGAKFGIYVREEGWWPEFMTQVGETDIYTIQFPAHKRYLNFVRFNSTKEAPGEGDIWNQVVNLNRENDNNCLTVTGWGGQDGKSTGAWRKYFPDLEEGYYLAGTFNSWEPTPADKFAGPNDSEYTIEANLVIGDRFKAISLDGDKLLTGWYPSSGDGYEVTEWTAGLKTIYFKTTSQQAWGGYFYIAPNEPVFTYSDFEIDLRNGQLGTEGNNMQKYLKVADPYVYYDQQPVESNARLNAARFNNTEDPSHGYVNFVATIPVVAGNYKITVGNCKFNSTNGAVKNEDGSETLNLIDKNGQTITAIETPENCYHQNTTENVTSVWFVAEAAQTIQIVCPQYAPYIKVEQVAEVPEEVIVYNVTFANAEGATGVLPANLVDLAPTTAITLPKNFSMYKEGYTFVGWTDGEDVYDPGYEYEVTDDVTFTAVYAENTVSLASRTEAVTIKWEFSQSKGVAPIDVSGTTTFVVAQATIGESKIDVKLPIDATEGKFVNSANSWTQINPGVIFSIPSAKDAVITYKQYDNGDVTTPEINVSATDATYDLIAAGTSGKLYYEYVQVVLPEPTATGIDNTVAGEKAVKVLRNGQLFIEKNGKTYNVLGTVVK